MVEVLAAAALAMVHLSRLAEEITWWSNPRFGFVHVADAFSTGSSMMPNKKNPDPAELVRGRTAGVIGALTGMLTLLKGLPLAYQRDLQEDKPPLFAAVSTLGASLGVMAGLVETLTVDRARMRAAAEEGYTTATALADALVLRGVPFRAAHHIVGGLVGGAEAEGIPALAALPDEAFRARAGRQRRPGRARPHAREGDRGGAARGGDDRGVPGGRGGRARWHGAGAGGGRAGGGERRAWRPDQGRIRVRGSGQGRQRPASVRQGSASVRRGAIKGSPSLRSRRRARGAGRAPTPARGSRGVRSAEARPCGSSIVGTATSSGVPASSKACSRSRSMAGATTTDGTIVWSRPPDTVASTFTRNSTRSPCRRIGRRAGARGGRGTGDRGRAGPGRA